MRGRCRARTFVGQIQRALGRSDGATKVLLHRAIRQLEGMVSETVTGIGQSA